MFAATSARSSVIARSSGGKIDIKKQGLNSVGNEVVRKNLMGVSEKMKDKNWVDSSGRKGEPPMIEVLRCCVCNVCECFRGGLCPACTWSAV